MTLEINFYELKEEAQKKVLEFYQIKSPEEMNWDTFPLFILEEDESDIEHGDGFVEKY